MNTNTVQEFWSNNKLTSEHFNHFKTSAPDYRLGASDFYTILTPKKQQPVLVDNIMNYITTTTQPQYNLTNFTKTNTTLQQTDANHFSSNTALLQQKQVETPQYALPKTCTTSCANYTIN